MSGNPISRRDFLRLLGYGSIALTLGPLLKFGDQERLKQLTPLTASAQSAGSWVEGPHTTVVAIHGATYQWQDILSGWFKFSRRNSKWTLPG